MPSIVERCQNIWDGIRQGKTSLPGIITIPHDHINIGEKVGVPFLKGEHYFQVRINEMYLAYDRQWFSRYAPMVSVVSEFIYDKREEAVPFVVGPSMLKQFGQEIPVNMVFRDTRAVGPHPYHGGRLSLAVILYQIRREDYARDLLHLIENITNVLNVSLPLSNYMKVADTALDGIESIMGLQDTVPLLGARKEFDPDGNDVLQSGYFALIDLPNTQVDSSQFWVINQRLHYGQSLAQAVPYQNASFVLYSITQSDERSDLRTLPFYPLYERILADASEPYDTIWERTKVNMTTLAQQLILSPDLTSTHADRLTEQYTTEMVKRRKIAVARGMLGPTKKVSSVEKRLSETFTILSL